MTLLLLLRGPPAQTIAPTGIPSEEGFGIPTVTGDGGGPAEPPSEPVQPRLTLSVGGGGILRE